MISINLGVSKIGISNFSCKEVALEDLTARLEELRDSPTTIFAVLLGETNNLLGIGSVTEVNNRTATLTLGPLVFTVNLCCLCTIFSSSDAVQLASILQQLGIIQEVGTLSNLANLHN